MEGSGIDIKKGDETFDGVDGVYLLKSAEEFKRLSRGKISVSFGDDAHGYIGFYEDIKNAKHLEEISSRIYKRKHEEGNDKFKSDTIRIGTFNVGGIDSLDMIGKIMQNMDILLVQELSEKDYKELENKQDKVIEIGHTGKYKYAISKRQESIKVSRISGKEETIAGSYLAIFFDTNLFSYLSETKQPSYIDKKFFSSDPKWNGIPMSAGIRTTNFEYLLHNDTGKKIAVMSVHLPVPNGEVAPYRAQHIMNQINYDVPEIIGGVDYVFVGGDFNQKYDDMPKFIGNNTKFILDYDNTETHSSYSGDFNQRLDYIIWVEKRGNELTKLSVDYGDPNIKELATNIDELIAKYEGVTHGETKDSIERKIKNKRKDLQTHNAKLQDMISGHQKSSEKALQTKRDKIQRVTEELNDLTEKLRKGRYLPSQNRPYDHLLVSYTFRLS